MKTAAGLLNWFGSHMWEKAIKYSHGQLAGVKLWYLVQSNNNTNICTHSVGITKLQLQACRPGYRMFQRIWGIVVFYL